MATLMELTADLKLFEQFVADFDGDVTDEQRADRVDLIFAAMAENEADLEDKLDGYVAIIAELEETAEWRKREAARLVALSGVGTNRAQWLRGRLKLFLEQTGRQKYETRRHKISIANNGGKLPVVYNEGIVPAAVDAQFQEEVPAVVVLDKDAVRAYLEAGNELPWARLGERGNQLRIK